MSLSSAMYSGVSGLLMYGNAMNVIGDNIANVNTVGFKSSRSVFADILAATSASGGGSLQFGRGAMLTDVQGMFTQGSFESTSSATDMGIQGEGFFVVRDPAKSFTAYTRAGQFILDKSANLVNPMNHIVQGYRLNYASGIVTNTGNISDISFTGARSAPNATTFYRLGLNLNSAASAGSTFMTSYNVYNSLGEQITISYTFTKLSGGNSWSYTSAASAGTLSGAAATGTITFDPYGKLSNPTTNLTMSIAGFPSGAANQTMTWSFLDRLGQPLNDITGYASPSVLNSLLQDGYTVGTLRSISTDDRGIISGLFSNGQSVPMFQIVLANFASPWGLTKLGNGEWAESSASGQPLLGEPNTASLGSILGSALELSNVDLGSEFVSMIHNQRAYQANSRIITTVDDMLAEAVNMKR